MSLYEKHPMPGAPYLVAAVLALWALLHCYELPQQPEVLAAKAFGAERGHEEAAGLLSELTESTDSYDD